MSNSLMVDKDRSIHIWKRIVLYFYAGYFAYLLPFLCWGALVAPEHQHTHAHWVFAEPSAASSSTHPSAYHVHLSMDGSDPLNHPHPHAHHYHPIADSTNLFTDSRSIPELSTISILLLLLSGLWAVYLFRLHHFPTTYAYSFPKSTILSVPVPPPQPVNYAI